MRAYALSLVAIPVLLTALTLVFGKNAADGIVGLLKTRGPASLEGPKYDSALVTETSSCDLGGKAGSGKQVYIFKQWHLSPGENTTDIAASKDIPQHENQKALYEQLDRWIARGTVSTILAEGCPAPRAIDSSSPEKFNGWSMAALESKSSSTEYPDIVTNVAYKLAAKWKGKVRVSCGDNADAIKKELMAFSDARGEIGFLSRLQQYKNDPERSRGYLDGVIELYHLKKSATVAQAIHRLDRELKKTVDSIEKWNHVRNAKLADVIASNPAPEVAVVFGGAHANGVEKLLEKKGIACSVYEPAGYQDDETKMLTTLKTLVHQRLRAM